MANESFDYSDHKTTASTEGPANRHSMPANRHSMIVAGLAAGLVVALAGDVYLTKQSRDMRQDVANVEAASQTQISKLSEDTTQRLNEQQKQWQDTVADRVKSANDTAAAAVRRARAEADKKTSELSQQIDDAHSQLASSTSELNALKDTTNSKFTEVTTDADQTKANLETVKTSVATAQTQLESTAADLKRAVGDMGVMSGLIATNSKDVDLLRAMGERNYFEFDLSKGSAQKVGNVMLTLKKSDAKRNRYTVDILADDKHVEKKDRTINEPVQLYVGGGMQPYEIVVNAVNKDKISGYLSTPKMKLARR